MRKGNKEKGGKEGEREGGGPKKPGWGKRKGKDSAQTLLIPGSAPTSKPHSAPGSPISYWGWGCWSSNLGEERGEL